MFSGFLISMSVTCSACLDWTSANRAHAPHLIPVDYQTGRRQTTATCRVPMSRHQLAIFTFLFWQCCRTTDDFFPGTSAALVNPNFMHSVGRMQMEGDMGFAYGAYKVFTICRMSGVVAYVGCTCVPKS